MSDLLQTTISSIQPCDAKWYAEAARYQQRLTMPPASLGRLLDIGRQLAAIQQCVRPKLQKSAVVVMAADHGVAREGVSAYPQEVTGQMVANYLNGGAAINALTRRSGTQVLVVDMGVRHLPKELADDPRLIHRSIRPGTCNFLEGPAMSQEDAETALEVGIRLAESLAADGIEAVGLGEMGIGNTTSASALAAVFTGIPAEMVVGRGTGLDDERLKHKIAVVEQAHALHLTDTNPKRERGNPPAEPSLALRVDGDRPDLQSTLETAAALGGFEILGLAGLALGAARQRIAVVLDGFISSTAGLIAARLCPRVIDYCFAAHFSVERGHVAVLDALGLVPLFDLQMRLGEGTGAALALHLLGSAADIMQYMATFENAGVSDKESAGEGVKSAR